MGWGCASKGDRLNNTNWEILEMLKRFALAAIAALFMCSSASADLIITTTNVATVVDFETTIANVNNGQFTGAGVSADPEVGELDSDTFTFSGISSDKLDQGSSSGGETSSGLYSFDTSATAGGSVASLGLQPSGSTFTPGSVTMSVMNDTGLAINSWDIGYDLFVLNDQARANELNFSFSTNGTDFTAVTALDFVSDQAAEGSPEWVRNQQSTNLSASVADGAQLFLRWSGHDVSGSGSRDEFAIDNISVTANVAAVPEPASAAVLGLVAACGVFVRRRK